MFCFFRQKVVLKLDFHDEKCRQKVMKTASGISGVESVAMDKDQKLTVTGDIDPVVAVRKLRKLCHTDIVSVGPAKEPEKKKEEPKKDEKKADANKNQPAYSYNLVYYPPMTHYHAPIYMEEDPAGCVIC
ncbi:hypothetical protein like AT5G52760 [Hibiscus trionum]|uniref:HMA domain-containing protein n=1 Tax=Hibiscus trionum TaxID=183268 RepID=A0A9W7J1X0_HIBTR|nr:hypothetical protein like AT5G52760 [Hibiscus trionum]